MTSIEEELGQTNKGVEGKGATLGTENHSRVTWDSLSNVSVHLTLTCELHGCRAGARGILIKHTKSMRHTANKGIKATRHVGLHVLFHVLGL